MVFDTRIIIMRGTFSIPHLHPKLFFNSFSLMKSSEEKKKKNKGNTKEKEEDSEQQLENQEGEAK